jgi:hypothetical protein
VLRSQPCTAGPLRLRSFAAALLLVFAAHAASSQNSTGYSVHGTVLNSVTHQPVARALVQLSNQDAMFTDNEGRFEFSSVPAGTLTVMVRRPGYVTNRQTGIGGGRGMDATTRRVQVGADMPELQIGLLPEAMISGTATLSTSDPADGIRISVFARHVTLGHSTWITAGTATTNSEGIYHIAGLTAGTYLIYSQPTPDRPAASGANAWGYPPTWYPGATDASAAGSLTVAAGQTVQADIALTRQRFYPVLASVQMGQSGMQASFQILDSAGRTTGLSARYNRQQQTIQASVPAGHYILEAHSFGRTPSFGRREFTIAGAAVTTLSIVVLPVQNIPVNIRRDVAASGANAPPVTTNGPGINLQLLSSDELAGQPLSGGNLRPVPGTSDGSSFELQNVTPGRYWVVTSAWTGYISSISSGGVDLGREPLSIGPGGSSPPIDITLRSDGGTISGQINMDLVGANQNSGQTSAPGVLPQMYIYAISLFSTTGQVQQGSAQPSGQFTISNLAPGSYHVVACDSQQQIDFHSPEGLAAWTGKGQTVTVEAGASASVQLDLLHTEGQP